jgi:hypothetical protein
MDRVSVLPNERIDISDYEAGAGGRLVETDQIRQGRVFAMPAGRTITTALIQNQANTQARIMGGFNFNAIVFGTDATAVLNRGRGWLPYRNDDGALAFGLLQGEEGSPTVTLDFSGATASSTQAVYVRAVGTQAQFSNRVLWNPGSSVEFVDNVSTRRVQGWEAMFQEVSVAPPGNGEWTKIWHVTLNGTSKIASITDRRVFYFEGDAGASYTQEWGDGTNDRNDDRATYGIQDNHLFVQAVRRQLGDILADKWWKAPNLTRLFRFVTVNTPGGGPTGDYATIDAAVTALNAGNGGTILLKAGTYAMTVAQIALKRINLVAVDGGVFLRNEVNANSFMFTYSVGSEGSFWEGITTIDHATLSSEKAVKAQNLERGILTLRNCIIGGETWVSQSTFYAEGSRFADTGVTHNYSDTTLRFSGSGVWAKFTRCVVQGGTHATRLDTVLITAVLSYAAGDRSSIVFDSTNSLVTNTATRSIYVPSGVSTACDVVWMGCQWFVNPPNASTRCLLVEAGNCSFKDCTLKVKASGDNFNNAVFYGNVANDDEAVNIDGFRFDFNNISHRMPNVDEVGIVLKGRRCIVRNMTVFNVLLPDATVQASGYCFILTDPSAVGFVSIEHSEFFDIANSGVNSQNVKFIGQPAAATGPGRIRISNNQFDTANVAFRNGASGGDLLFIAGSANGGIQVTHNYMTGGVWSRAIRILKGGVDVSYNHLIFPTVSIGFDQIVHLVGATTETVQGYCNFTGNMLFHGNMVGAESYVEISGFRTAGVQNNQDVDNNTGTPTNGGMYVHDITSRLTIHANAFEDGTTTAAIGAQKPATTGDQNF